MRYNQPSRFLEEIAPQHLESTNPLPRRTATATGHTGAKVIGNFKRSNSGIGLKVDPSTFKPSPSDSIQTGMKVLHMKFGAGKVVSVDGGSNNRVATIHFEEIENPERRIMLRFAKLQIL